MRFDPDDERGFQGARDRLAGEFGQTAEGAGLEWVAEQVLDLKWGYLGGDLATWRPRDVEEILLEIYPRKVVLERSDLPDVIRGFAGLLRFLDAAAVLTTSTRGAELATLVEELAAPFAAAMADESRWGMGKRLLGSAAAQGFDLSDPSQLEDIVAAFNARPIEERDAILGAAAGLPAGAAYPAPGLPVPPLRLPPVTLAPEGELVAAATASVWPKRVRRFVEYIGAGRPLTDTGNLKLADGKALVGILETGDTVDEVIGERTFRTRSSAELPTVDLTYALAEASGLVQVVGRRVLPVQDASLRDASELDTWYGLFLTLLHRVGPNQHHWRGGDPYGFGWYAEELDATLPRLLLELYRTQGPLDFADLAAEAWDTLLDAYDLEGTEPSKLAFHQRLVTRALARSLQLLEEFGVLRLVDVEAQPDDSPAPPESVGSPAPTGSVGLTDLGVWAINRLLSQVTDAPVVGDLVDVDAAELLARAPDLADDLATAEVDAWLARRGHAGAEALVAAMPGASEVGRGLAFRALLRLGPSVGDAVERLADDPDLRAYATVWRVDAQVATADEMVAGNPADFVRLLHAVLVVWGPQAVAGWVGPAAGARPLTTVIESLWRVPLPQTEEVLGALGAHVPDKAVAKAARKALFKLRSAKG